VNAQSWRISGEAVVLCNCDWGCPCQFNALPTTGRCEAVGVWEVRKGHFGPTGLEGVRFARIYSWPGPIHEGNGTRQLIVDEKADEQQRQALDALDRGEEGGPYFEVFAAVCPNRLETVTTPIERGSAGRGSCLCSSSSPSVSSSLRRRSICASRSPSPAMRRSLTAKEKPGEEVALPA